MREPDKNTYRHDFNFVIFNLCTQLDSYSRFEISFIACGSGLQARLAAIRHIKSAQMRWSSIVGAEAPTHMNSGQSALKVLCTDETFLQILPVINLIFPEPISHHNTSNRHSRIQVRRADMVTL